jgi:predicted TIM-barrel fold metal-dependent hydrolase
MHKPLLALFLIVAANLCGAQAPLKRHATTPPQNAQNSPVRGPFSSRELRQFIALEPVDSHTHVYEVSPALNALLKKLNLRILDILVDDDTVPECSNFAQEAEGAWAAVHAGQGRIALCTTFNAYKFNHRDFSREAIRQLNDDFSRGAIAVKFYKVVGMEIKDSQGHYIMPDDPVFEPIFRDIAAYNKTLIAHLADPNSAFEAPNPAAPDYDYLMQNPKLYMYGKVGAPTKQEILLARDRILQRNPSLRMVGAHLGSMESDLTQLGEHLDRYPNFAVDLAARMPYFELQPRAKMIAFISKYQDRLIYGTDNELAPEVSSTVSDWQNAYANDWRYLATGDILMYRNKRVEGLALSPGILRKIYHDNAARWFPGIAGKSR